MMHQSPPRQRAGLAGQSFGRTAAQDPLAPHDQGICITNYGSSRHHAESSMRRAGALELRGNFIDAGGPEGAVSWLAKTTGSTSAAPMIFPRPRSNTSPRASASLRCPARMENSAWFPMPATMSADPWAMENWTAITLSAPGTTGNSTVAAAWASPASRKTACRPFR